MIPRFIAFFLPAALWLFLMRDFVLGTIPVNMDTNTIYGVTKFYFNNLLNGVVPLWEPFVALGRPFYALSICNLFNPVTLIVPLLKILGVNYAHGFVIYMVIYFFVGCVGFYLLALELLKNQFVAYLAYVAIMFSSFGASMFTQFTFLEIVVPGIWIFVFVLRFARQQSKGNFIGMAFSKMLLLSSYLPFYFITVFFCLALPFLALYFKETKTFVINLWQFIRKHWRLVFFCFLGMLAAAGPLLAYKILDGNGEVVAPGRHCQYTSVEQCYERTMSHQGGMLFEEITRAGTLGERFDLQYLFGNLDKISYGSDSLFFLPVFILIVFGLSIFLPLGRLTMLLSSAGLLAGLVALGAASGLLGFLYHHVFFFAYFRNLFFLGAFLVPLIILLACHQMQLLFDFKIQDGSQRKFIIVGIVMLHILIGIFLKHYLGIPKITWITLGLSTAGWAAFFIVRKKLSMQLWVGIFSIVMFLEPAWLLHNYAIHAKEFTATLPSMHVRPQFQWTRSLTPAVNNSRIYQFVPYEDFWYDMSMTDAPPIVAYPQSVIRWTFDLAQHTPARALANYAQYKIILYDGVNPSGIPVNGPSDEISAEHFDVNSLTLHINFSKPMLLVYNDSYTSSWKAAIDGSPADLTRANEAFKGVRVPAGEHTVEFFYHPPGGSWVYLLATGALLFFLGLTIYSLRYA